MVVRFDWPAWRPPCEASPDFILTVASREAKSARLDNSMFAMEASTWAEFSVSFQDALSRIIQKYCAF